MNQLYKTLRPYVEQYKINADFSSTDNEKVFYTTKTKGESLYEIADGTGVSDLNMIVGAQSAEQSGIRKK